MILTFKAFVLIALAKGSLVVGSPHEPWLTEAECVADYKQAIVLMHEKSPDLEMFGTCKKIELRTV